MLPNDIDIRFKKNVWSIYWDVCLNADINPVSYSHFVELWAELVPWIVIAKPATDLCWISQQYSQMVGSQVNVDDDDKAQLLNEYNQHLTEAKTARRYYKDQCSQAKQCYPNDFDAHSPSAPYSFDGVAHYSWDYAQQLHYFYLSTIFLLQSNSCSNYSYLEY